MAARVTAEQVSQAAAEPLLYFSHDYDAADDMKCRKLLRRFGFAGYGRWWRICELMAGEQGHALSIQEADDLELLADLLDFASREDLKDFLIYLSQVGLIDEARLADGEVWSERMFRNSQQVGKRRMAGRSNGKKGGRPRKQD